MLQDFWKWPFQFCGNVLGSSPGRSCAYTNSKDPSLVGECKKDKQASVKCSENWAGSSVCVNMSTGVLGQQLIFRPVSYFMGFSWSGATRNLWRSTLPFDNESLHKIHDRKSKPIKAGSAREVTQRREWRGHEQHGTAATKLRPVLSTMCLPVRRQSGTGRKGDRQRTLFFSLFVDSFSSSPDYPLSSNCV